MIESMTKENKWY